MLLYLAQQNREFRISPPENIEIETALKQNLDNVRI